LLANERERISGKAGGGLKRGKICKGSPIKEKSYKKINQTTFRIKKKF